MEYLLKIIKDNNLIILFLLIFFFMHSLNIDKNKHSLKLKIAIASILIFLLSSFNIIDASILIIIYLVATFIFIQIINADYFQKEIIKKTRYLLLDYFYKIIFDYGLLYLLLSIFITSDHLSNLLLDIKLYSDHIDLFKIIFFVIGVFVLLKCIVICLTNDFETLSFNDINKKVNSIMPFSKFKLDDYLVDFSKMLISKEDKSFFEREESYTWVSREFIKYRVKNNYYTNNKGFKYYMGALIYAIKDIFNFILLIIKRIFKFIINKICNKFRKKKKEYPLSRGYSTIEMQLIRTLAVKSGYTTHKYRRKIYEFIYSTIYFNCLKSYYKYYNYNYINNFKYYLIYLYILVAPVSFNDVKHSSILKLYNKDKLSLITKEEFYLWTIGLSYSDINDDILNYYGVEEFGLDKDKLKKLINKYK